MIEIPTKFRFRYLIYLMQFKNKDGAVWLDPAPQGSHHCWIEQYRTVFWGNSGFFLGMASGAQAADLETVPGAPRRCSSYLHRTGTYIRVRQPFEVRPVYIFGCRAIDLTVLTLGKKRRGLGRCGPSLKAIEREGEREGYINSLAHALLEYAFNTTLSKYAKLSWNHWWTWLEGEILANFGWDSGWDMMRYGGCENFTATWLSCGCRGLTSSQRMKNEIWLLQLPRKWGCQWP